MAACACAQGGRTRSTVGSAIAVGRSGAWADRATLTTLGCRTGRSVDPAGRSVDPAGRAGASAAVVALWVAAGRRAGASLAGAEAAAVQEPQAGQTGAPCESDSPQELQ
jgi:lipid-binding SYLF domain-containing protein